VNYASSLSYPLVGPRYHTEIPTLLFQKYVFAINTVVFGAKIDQIRNSRLSQVKSLVTFDNYAPLLSSIHALCSLPRQKRKKTRASPFLS